MQTSHELRWNDESKNSINSKFGSVRLQVRERLYAKTFLKTFSEVGRTAEAGIEGCLGDVAIF